jgi:protein O-mannosyl-transferase
VPSAMRRPGPHAVAACIGLVAAAIHARSLSFEFTDLDDRDLIVDDYAFLRQPAAILRAFARPYLSIVDGEHPYYRPLVTISYVLDARWTGLRPVGYHLTNVILHAAASVLLYALLRRLAFGEGVTLLAALVFAVLPVLTAAVAWIPGRNDSLLAVFAFSSWLFFLRDAERPSWIDRSLHLVFFSLALLTKETALALPLVCAIHLCLVEPTAFARIRRSRDALFVAGGWLVIVLTRVLARPVPGDTGATELWRGPGLVLASLGQLVLPTNLSLFSIAADLPLWPGVLAASVLVVAARLAPGVRWRVATLGGATFLLFLLPTLLVPGTLIQNSRLYLPAAGVVVSAAEIVRALWARDRTLVLSSFATTVAALAAVTIGYEGSFRDRRSFAKNAVDAAPHSPLAHFCLGQSYQRDGASDRALAEYRLALQLGATYVVHNNMGVIFMADGRWPEAERELREELAVDPRYIRAYRNLAIVLRHEGRLEESRRAEEQADQLEPP